MNTQTIDYLRNKALGLHPILRDRCERLATTIDFGTMGGFETPSEYLEADGARLTGLMHSAVLGEIDFPQGLDVANISEALSIIYTAARISALAKAA